MEFGCWHEAERCDRVALQLQRIRGQLIVDAYNDITRLLLEVEATSRLLRDVYDLFWLYRERAYVVEYYLNLILACLQRTLRDMMVYVDNDGLPPGRQWVLMIENLGDQGYISLSDRFVL
jgi:hypothetical protein